MTATTTSTSTSNILSSAGRDLLLEIKRHQDSSLPPYNLKLVRQCFNDLHHSFQCLSEEVQASSDGIPSMAGRPSMLWHHACIQRQKRCLLAYHKHRLDSLKNQVLAHPSASVDTSTWSSNGPELEFCQAYQQLRQGQCLPHPDTPPPIIAHSLQVRCIATLGQVVLESGRCVTITKGSVLYLPRQDVIEFLQDGTMQLLEGEEVDF